MQKIALILLSLVASVATANVDFNFVVHCDDSDYQNKAKMVTVQENGILELTDSRGGTKKCYAWEIVSATRTVSSWNFSSRPNASLNVGFTNGGLKVKDDPSLNFYPSKDSKLRKRIQNTPEILPVRNDGKYQVNLPLPVQPAVAPMQPLYPAGIPSQAVLRAANPQLPVVLLRDNTGNLIRVQ